MDAQDANAILSHLHVSNIVEIIDVFSLKFLKYVGVVELECYFSRCVRFQDGTTG